MAMTQNSIEPKTIRTSPKWFIFWIVVAIVMLAVPLVVTLALRSSSAGYKPIDIPLNLTQSLVQAASDKQNSAFPSNLSSDIQAANGECWTILKTALIRNKNQYQLEARLLPDNGPTGANQVLVDVVFTNGTKVEMYYYNGFLSSCRQL